MNPAVMRVAQALMDTEVGGGRPPNPLQADMMRGAQGPTLLPNTDLKSPLNYPPTRLQGPFFIPPWMQWPEIPVKDYRKEPL